MHPSPVSWITAASGLLAASLVQGAILIDGFSSGTHDRFANDPGFIAADYDLSGLGINASGRWGSLVSENVVLSAYHFFPAVGSGLTFYSGNDPSGPSITRTVLAGQRIGASDVWIGVLSDPVPPGYSAFSFTDEPVADSAAFAGSSLVGQPLFMVGRSPTALPVARDVALGANVANAWEDSITASGTTDQALVAYRDLPADPDYVSSEAFLQVGDSGAPVLRDVGGNLTIIGFNWFISQVDLDPRPRQQDLRDVSGFSYVGNYAAEVDAVIQAFLDDPSQGFENWRQTTFGSVSDLALTGTSVDFDLDGVINFIEYAFVLDPADPSSANPVQASRIQVGEDRYLQATVAVREDGQLNYTAHAGSDLSGWSDTAVTFAQGAWSSADPATVVLQSATDNGDGTWALVLRVAAPLDPGTTRLLRLSAR